jgi:branched-chain amino acid transport system permease protein
MDILFILSNAVVLTCIYGMLAIGISITWSSVGLINLSYGFIFAFAGYGAWYAAQALSENGAVVLAAGVLCGALGGVVVCALAFIPIHDKPNFTLRGLIATLAISLIGTQSLMWWFGPRSKNLPEIFGSWSVMVGDTALTADKIGNVLTSIAFVAAVVLWMRSSRRGLEIRAMMMNPHAASIVGIDVRSTGSSRRVKR